jgi:hypothetical protein
MVNPRDGHDWSTEFAVTQPFLHNHPERVDLSGKELIRRIGAGLVVVRGMGPVSPSEPSRGDDARHQRPPEPHCA